MWRRKGWAAMDQMREKLEALKELRDLVRSLGRGGGWGPLRRAPVQVRVKVVLYGMCTGMASTGLGSSPCTGFEASPLAAV